MRRCTRLVAGSTRQQLALFVTGYPEGAGAARDSDEAELMRRGHEPMPVDFQARPRVEPDEVVDAGEPDVRAVGQVAADIHADR